jgi:hypothetical protein
MIIEHKHFDTTKDKYDDGIWTVKVKHTSTIYPDKTDNNRELSIEASEQLTTTISNLTYNSQTAQETTTATDNPFTAGINFNAEMLPSNDISEETEQYYEESPYDVTEEKLTEARDYDQNTMDEKDKSMKMVERRKIMERHPRSGSFVYDVTEHENYKKGYNFYSGVRSSCYFLDTTGYSRRGYVLSKDFRGFTEVLQTNSGITSLNRSRPTTSKLLRNRKS